MSGTNCVKSGSPAQGDSGHGTSVAGIIPARDQGAGVVGVAPGTKLYSVKVLGKTGGGTLSQILCGINWVTANAAALNIKVANISFVGPGANDNTRQRQQGRGAPGDLQVDHRGSRGAGKEAVTRGEVAPSAAEDDGGLTSAHAEL